ncbi:hypothetical protein GCM10010307_75260 [Streptomyces vastus]|uniref:LLM class flavin-dependent oxidoreductase n=1 Tax=Streptomyces vastus TaxID=285451 RepID=A0ABP6E5Y4_9ACTN
MLGFRPLSAGAVTSEGKGVTIRRLSGRQPAQDYAEQIDDILALLAGTYRPLEGVVEFPTPEEARAHAWTDEDRALVQDRLDTQFVGSPGRVADQLEQLQEATEANELLITTITHDHADRVRSYELLADEWRRRGHSFHSS